MPKTTRARGSIRVARIFGIDIRLDWTFLLLVPLVALGSDLSQFWNSLLWIVAVFSSVLVHELAHCFVARRRGAVVEDILLMPIGGLSQMQQVPQAPADEAAIAVVGPLTSLALGLFFGAVGAVLVGARLWPPTLFAGPWFSRLAWLNLMLGAFNLLPALPMDGGRVLRAELARSHDRRSATRIAGGTARVIALAMAVVGVLYDYWLVVIALFVWLGARSEENAAAGAADDARHEEPSGRLGL